MNYKVLEEGFTELELENGTKLKFKIVIGSVTKIEGKKNPDGTQMYSMQHHMVSFVIEKT